MENIKNNSENEEYFTDNLKTETLFINGGESSSISDCMKAMIESSYPTFEKVPYDQFYRDWIKTYPCNDGIYDENAIRSIYDKIELPKRSTEGSAGHDFIMPFSFKLSRGSSIVIPTGIRCRMPNDTVLLIVPRSGQGFKYRLSIMNTVGVIDSDYYGADNYGHIMIKIVYDGDGNNTILSTLHLDPEDENMLVSLTKLCYEDGLDTVTIQANKGFAQGIFVKYIVTSNEIISSKNDIKKRTGGFGSTDT